MYSQYSLLAPMQEVNIEYRDEHGRALTQKEAFRQLCYSFHGYGPGKKKREKREKQLEEKEKSLSKDHSAVSS